MTDLLSLKERSKRMSLVHSKGNKSTEEFIKKIFYREKISGWRRHVKNIEGRPDFYFPKAKLAVFVDG